MSIPVEPAPSADRETSANVPPLAGSRELRARKGLRDDVYDAVLEMLLNGRLAPGETLAIDVVARDLGVSPSPVREAFVQLEHTGLVMRTPRKSYTVSPPLTASQVSELLDARALIEVEATRRAVPLSQPALESLRLAFAMQEQVGKRVDDRAVKDSATLDWVAVRQFYEDDWRFHLVIINNCGNHYLLEFATFLSPHVQRMRQIFHRGLTDVLTDVRQALSEHEEILRAVVSGDVRLAAKCMSDHLKAVRARSLADV